MAWVFVKIEREEIEIRKRKVRDDEKREREERVL